MAVYGLGKMGPSMAAVYAERSGNVTSVGIDPDVVATVNSGESHVKRQLPAAEAASLSVDSHSPGENSPSGVSVPDFRAS